MPDTMSQPVTPSAAAHAARIKARDEERAKANEQPDTRQTYEIYGERARAGFRADEELRQQARMSELRSRGVWTPGDEEVDDDAAAEEYEEEVLDDEDDESEEDAPMTTAELYARRERERQRAEHTANRAAWKGSTWTLSEQTRWLVG